MSSHTPPRPAHSRQAAGIGIAKDGGRSEVSWLVAEEVPVAFEYNGQAHAVMMATPADLEDFAVGFSLCEGILGSAEDISSVSVADDEDGIVLSIRCDPLRLLKGSLRRRSMEGRSGCGLCGAESLANVLRPATRIQAGTAVDPAMIAAAFAALHDHQPMNRLNRSLHAAAWCDADGRIGLAREDVGRHNALDKLIGGLAMERCDLSAGFALVSSRCSFELVQKAATVGIPLLASISAPTGLALKLAQEAGMSLAARDGDGGIVLFT